MELGTADLGGDE